MSGNYHLKEEIRAYWSARAEDVVPLLTAAGFERIEIGSRREIARAQRRRADLRNKLRTLVYRRFILKAVKRPDQCS